MLRYGSAVMFLVLLLQPGCSRSRPDTQVARPIEPTVSVEVSVCQTEDWGATFVHLYIKNQGTNPVKLVRCRDWAEEPPLVLNCYPARERPGYPVPRTEAGLRRWPEAPQPGDPDIRHHAAYDSATLGSHSSYAEVIPSNGFVTVRMPLSQYFRLNPERDYVLGGMVQVLTQDDRPMWLSFKPVQFRMPKH